MNSDTVIEFIKRRIAEEKEANKMLLDNFEDSVEFEMGLLIGMEAMHDCLSKESDLNSETNK